MAGAKEIVLAFDVYGTLLSTESIAKKLAQHVGQEKASSIAAEWRKYQLEYTWRLNSMSKCILYAPYLHHTTEEEGGEEEEERKKRLTTQTNTSPSRP